MFVCLVCLFGVFLSTQEFFIYMETSLLPLKGCQLWSILRSKGSLCVSHLLLQGVSVSYWSSQRTRNTSLYCCQRFTSKGLTLCSNNLWLSLLGFEHSILRMRDVLSYRVRHHTGLNYSYFSWQIYMFVQANIVFQFSS